MNKAIIIFLFSYSTILLCKPFMQEIGLVGNNGIAPRFYKDSIVMRPTIVKGLATPLAGAVTFTPKVEGKIRLLATIWADKPDAEIMKKIITEENAQEIFKGVLGKIVQQDSKRQEMMKQKVKQALQRFTRKKPVSIKETEQNNDSQVDSQDLEDQEFKEQEKPEATALKESYELFAQGQEKGMLIRTLGNALVPSSGLTVRYGELKGKYGQDKIPMVYRVFCYKDGKKTDCSEVVNIKVIKHDAQDLEAQFRNIPYEPLNLRYIYMPIKQTLKKVE